MLVCSVLMFDDQSELCDGSVSVTPTTDCHAATVSDGQIAKLYQIFRYHTDVGAVGGGGGGGGDPLLTQRQIYGVSRRQHLILHSPQPPPPPVDEQSKHYGSSGESLLYINVNHNHTSTTSITTPSLRYSIQRGDRAGVYNLLVNFDAETIWKIFTIFY